MICEAGIAALVSLSMYTVTLCDTGETYPVGVGQFGFQTPTGYFEVQYKELDPIWRNPFTNEVKGRGYYDYWISLGIMNPEFPEHAQYEFGFHDYHRGIGLAESHGCIRMFDNDASILYSNLEQFDIVHIIN